MSQFLGVILYSLLGISVAAEEVRTLPQNQADAMDGLSQRTYDRDDARKRRDPFRPIKKRRSLSSSSRKSQTKIPETLPIVTVKNPNWKLLGIIHGQYGRQAVIQVSSRERMFVRPGLQLAQSGWIIKAISKGEVLLEHLSASPTSGSPSLSETMILSFPALGKSR